MSLLPDPADIRAVADRIARHAAATRTRASVLGQAVAGVGWHGAAAVAFDGSAHGVVAALTASAAELDRAAAALRQHAENVATLLADLRHLGVDLSRSGHDLVQLLRDGADPLTLAQHPDHLLHDGVVLAKDGGHLVADGARAAGHVATATLHGVESAAGSMLSGIGL